MKFSKKNENLADYFYSESRLSKPHFLHKGCPLLHHSISYYIETLDHRINLIEWFYFQKVDILSKSIAKREKKRCKPHIEFNNRNVAHNNQVKLTFNNQNWLLSSSVQWKILHSSMNMYQKKTSNTTTLLYYHQTEKYHKKCIIFFSLLFCCCSSWIFKPIHLFLTEFMKLFASYFSLELAEFRCCCVLSMQKKAPWNRRADVRQHKNVYSKTWSGSISLMFLTQCGMQLF